jgi:transposase InsO family protein
MHPCGPRSPPGSDHDQCGVAATLGWSAARLSSRPCRCWTHSRHAGIQPSVGAVGSSYDNALAETINGLYKTELIKPRKPWRTIEDLEVSTAAWVHWFNHRRLYEYCGDIPPVELETAYYAQRRRPAAG